MTPHQPASSKLPFVYVGYLSELSNGTSPEFFGDICRDTQSGKEYLVDNLFENVNGVDHHSIFSIKEIVSRPDQTCISKKTFLTDVVTKDAEADVQDRMIHFFKSECDTNNGVFEDFRYLNATRVGSGLTLDFSKHALNKTFP